MLNLVREGEEDKIEAIRYRRLKIFETFLFSQFPAGIELATSESAYQCLIHWTTAASLNLLLQKLIFNCQARSQGPRIFSRWRPLFRASSKCLRPVSIMLATATPQSPALKRPLENLEL